MKLFFSVSVILLFLFPFLLLNATEPEVKENRPFIRIGFYNTENYFDPFTDTLSDYHEFDPGGNRHWDMERYRIKQQHIFKVIAAMGGWHGMDVMAFAEIENRFVLEDLLKNTPLRREDYGIVHFESPDHRGIDVGMIYRKNVFHLLFSEAIPVRDTAGKIMRTRDILYVKGRVGTDTLHLLINHWPSRYGGLMATVSKRMLAAKVLVHILDSVCHIQPNARILIMGDFNETLSDKALQYVIKSVRFCRIIPLLPHADFDEAKGTIRNQQGWTTFDRILCSKNFLLSGAPLFVKDKSFHIFDVPFLLERDLKNMGFRPNRTYIGFSYHGGFSDHLPVYVDTFIRQKESP